MTITITDVLLDPNTQEYRRSAADAAPGGRRAAVLCAPYSMSGVRETAGWHRVDKTACARPRSIAS